MYATEVIENMERDKIIYEIVEQIRHVPFNTFTNNCLIKSLRFRKECRKVGVKAAVVMTLGIVELNRFGIHAKLPFTHTWAYIDECRIEVARPLDQKSPWGSYDIDLKPIIGIWLW